MAQLSFVKFRKNSYILIEGKEDIECFYIIQSGQVRIVKESEVVVEEGGNILKAGDFLGVVSCMARHNQVETAIAVTDVVLIAVPYNQFPSLIAQNTPVAMKIIYSFSRKMRYLDEALTRITLKKNVSPGLEHLFTIGEYYMRMGKFSLAVYPYYHYLKAMPNGKNIQKAKDNLIAIQNMNVHITSEMIGSNNESSTRLYKGEAMVFCECQTGSELYIIQKGQVKITKIVDENEVLLALLKEGDMFGEMALLENKPRSASASMTEEGGRLLAVNYNNFKFLVSTQPQLIASLTTTFAERIWSMYRQLDNTQIMEPLEKMYDMLALQFEKTHIKPMPMLPYSFNFGPIELANMCGIPKQIMSSSVADFLQEPIVRCENSKIVITDQLELEKKAAYFKRMQQIEAKRREIRAKSGNYW